ncbi:Predicted enolase-phosphatase [Serratia entomophila]|jgi:enolase-phosphatase E1|uniref:acireductone synthase n=1 Tax=Serratia entomophila TaxID=42906 RepID=UPI001F44E4EC|nr:acireductone synthase [Serratia entomophila]UIW19159.1 acireductone synthase [Serratia entomophila]CAI0765940.1 Predicted enolase-phosphatase [Serratia entomophila]CAI0827069.1 Predicted enolase-phosphatase [Serratia entomophila]CAI0830891.1 Predicted enolase-phosphatase [Serratia entomophila]CAI0831073.1 Predicted enolase-phosphatase [Serratia entomophila]
MIRAIVTDIEGTTSDIRFVHQVLFPYARARLADFLRSHAEDAEVAAPLVALRQEIERPEADIEQLTAALYRFMDEDRKSTALKALQGIIWRSGYLNGDFRGHLYPEVAAQLAAWQRQGLRLYVYSSGSVEAQKLLFGYSDAGDLQPLFSGYFDTHVGAKRETASYRNIAQAIGLAPDELLFLSDIHQELDAALAAGWHTCQLIRDQADAHSRHPQVNRFDQIDLREFAS